MQWNNEKVLNLIEMYRDRPVLWDSKLEIYKNRNKRHDALLEIATFFGTEKEEIQRKINNLLCHFSREVKREREGNSSGAGADEAYKSKWFAFKALKFLKDKNTPRETADTEVMEEHQSEEIQEIGNYEGEDKITQREKAKPFKSPKKKIRKFKLDNDPVIEAISIMKEIQGRKQERDEYSLFGEPIALKMRKLPTDHSRIMVQHMINNILFDAEMGKYNNPVNFNSNQTFYPSTCASPHNLSYAHMSHSSQYEDYRRMDSPSVSSNFSNASSSQSNPNEFVSSPEFNTL